MSKKSRTKTKKSRTKAGKSRTKARAVRKPKKPTRVIRPPRVKPGKPATRIPAAEEVGIDTTETVIRPPLVRENEEGEITPTIIRPPL
jgi:hypothetical protein